MKLKTILPVVAVAGVLMCEPAVLLHAGTSDFASPEAMGWFRKKKKSETKDSVQSKSDYENLTGSDAIARRRRAIITLKCRQGCWDVICW